MLDPDHNRMAQPRRRGPLPGNITTPLPMPAEEVAVPQAPLAGIRCPGCGRGVVPRRDRVTSAAKCYAHCQLCGARMVLTFENGKPKTVRLVRPGEQPS